MNFTKMQGTGNDFVVIDDRDEKYRNRESEVAKVLCSRHFGIGADGILLVRNCSDADIEMIIINADGSYAAMCGNGIRCFAKYVYEDEIVKKSQIKIKTGDGIKVAQIEVSNDIVEKVTIYMGKPEFNPNKIPAASNKEVLNYNYKADNGKTYKLNSVLVGVPHTVIVGELDKTDVKEGKFIEKSSLFPNGTNVNFCEVKDRKNIKVKTWERGAGATLSCGTGCCSSVIICERLGLIDKKVLVSISGGELEIEVKENGIYMSGTSEISFRGETNLI
ncbi:MAG: diaminopimelate epimerase [Clostridium sp.]|nr:diaminopimelate epimerase [Clostridium sp.]